MLALHGTHWHYPIFWGDFDICGTTPIFSGFRGTDDICGTIIIFYLNGLVSTN